MKRILTLLVALCMVVGLMAGCSSEPAADSSAAASTESSAATESSTADAGESEASGNFTSDEKIYIGMTAPITGNNAEYGKTFSVAAQICIDDWNAEGGINGKEIVMDIMDSRGDAKDATEIAQKFGQDEKYLAVIGDFTSSCCMAAAPVYDENHLVMITPSASHVDLCAMSPYVFSVAGRQDGESPFIAQYLTQKFYGSELAVLMYVNSDWGVTCMEQFKGRAESVGLEVAAYEPYMEGEKDFTATLTKLQQTGADTIVLMSQAQEAAVISQQIRQMGWDVNIAISGGAYSQQLIDLGGDAVEGTHISSPVDLSKEHASPEALEFMEKFEEQAGYPTPTHAPWTYDACEIVFQAIKRADDAGNLTREAVRDELQATKDYDGFGGPITEFSEDGDLTRTYLICEIKDGAFNAVTDFSYGME